MNRLITILFLGMMAIIMQEKTDKEQLTNEARAEGKLACTLHLHVLRHIEKDNDNSSICSFFVFR